MPEIIGAWEPSANDDGHIRARTVSDWHRTHYRVAAPTSRARTNANRPLRPMTAAAAPGGASPGTPQVKLGPRSVCQAHAAWFKAPTRIRSRRTPRQPLLIPGFALSTSRAWID